MNPGSFTHTIQNIRMHSDCILCLSGQRRLSCSIHPLNLRTMSWWSSSSKESSYGWGSPKLKRWVRFADEIPEEYAWVDASLRFLSLVVQAQGKVRRHGRFTLQAIPGVPLLHLVLFPLSLPIVLIVIPLDPILSSLCEVWGSADGRVWLGCPAALGPPSASRGCAALLLRSGQSGHRGRLRPRGETGRSSGQKKDETEQSRGRR